MKTSWEKAQAERHRQLAELWQCIDRLDEKGWERLYGLVVEILSRCSKANLAETGLELPELIDCYFIQKIFEPAQTDPAKLKRQMPLHHGALIGFFQRFAIDMARRAESRGAGCSAPLEDEEGRISQEAEACGCRQDFIDRLQAHGFSLGTLETEAEVFLAAMSPIERTVMRNYCNADLSITKLFPGSPQQQSLARVAVAQMGLWSGKTQGRDLEKFSATRLGRFMAKAIGQPLDNTHLDTMNALMSLLCELA